MTREALNDDQRANVTIAGKMSYTIAQAAAQLTRTGESWSDHPGEPTVVTYAYRETAPAQMPGDTSGFRPFSYQQIEATQQALKLWSDVSEITFQRVDDGSGYSNDATILFGDYTSGETGAAAFAYMPGSRASASAAGDVWVNSNLSANAYVTDQNDYGFLTLVHEIGHAIGLSHPSDYDVSDQGDNITYQQNASYYEDSLEYSVMSYFDASVTGSNVENTLDAPGGPLIDDIAAAQRLYGADTATATGDTVYGDAYDPGGPGTPTADGYLRGTGGPIWGTIWDAGGVDRIDGSASGANQKIDLRPGSFSDFGGAVGDLSIAAGVIIENATGGSGNDTLIGNDYDNVLRGGAGADTLMGGVGNDTYVGGDGADRAVLGGNTHDYTLIDGGAAGLILHGINGSGNSWIDPSTDIVQFQNGQYLSLGDVHAYVQPGDPGAAVQLAPVDGTSYVDGGTGADHLYVDADASDFTLSRDDGSGPREGDFILTETHGDAVIHVGEAIDQVDFLNGQYLALDDLPYFVSGNAAIGIGGAQNDLIYQTLPAGFEFFDGGAGDDQLYLKGNVGDYSVLPIAAWRSARPRRRPVSSSSATTAAARC